MITVDVCPHRKKNEYKEKERSGDQKNRNEISIRIHVTLLMGHSALSGTNVKGRPRSHVAILPAAGHRVPTLEG